MRMTGGLLLDLLNVFTATLLALSLVYLGFPLVPYLVFSCLAVCLAASVVIYSVTEARRKKRRDDNNINTKDQ